MIQNFLTRNNTDNTFTANNQSIDQEDLILIADIIGSRSYVNSTIINSVADDMEEWSLHRELLEKKYESTYNITPYSR